MIGVVWKPNVLSPQQFKVSLMSGCLLNSFDASFSRSCKLAAECHVQEQRLQSQSADVVCAKSVVLSQGKENSVLDTEAVIADFKLMGAGLVKTVQVGT